MNHSVTLQDVASAAGVSLATASRVLNGSQRTVAGAYRERVLSAAATLQYSPNLSAQAVARGRSNTIGLLVADIVDPYFSAIAAGAMAAADDAELIVTISVTERDIQREIGTIKTLRGQRPRAIVLAGSRPAEAAADAGLASELRSYVQAGGRVVLIAETDLHFPTIALNNYQGARDLGSRLAPGYRQAAIIAGPEHLVTTAERTRGFSDGFGRDRVATCAAPMFTRDGGFAATGNLLDQGLGDIDLIFAGSDVMAMGAMAALRSAGFEPGRDIGVAGFDDIATVQDVTPALTTVRVPLETMGYRAVELALQEDSDADRVPIDSQVVLRESTPAVPAGGGR